MKMIDVENDLDIGFDLIFEQTNEVLDEKYQQFVDSLTRILNSIMGGVIKASSFGEFSYSYEVVDLDLLPHINDIFARAGFEYREIPKSVPRGEDNVTTITIGWKVKTEFSEYNSILDSLNGRLELLKKSKTYKKEFF